MPNFSVVDFLNSRGLDASKQSRAAMASKLGIEDYDFSADKNLELLHKLHAIEALHQSNQPITQNATTQSFNDYVKNSQVDNSSNRPSTSPLPPQNYSSDFRTPDQIFSGPRTNNQPPPVPVKPNIAQLTPQAPSYKLSQKDLDTYSKAAIGAFSRGLDTQGTPEVPTPIDYNESNKYSLNGAIGATANKIGGWWDGFTQRFLPAMQAEDKEALLKAPVQQAAPVSNGRPQLVKPGYTPLGTVRDMKGLPSDSLAAFTYLNGNDTGGRYIMGHDIAETPKGTVIPNAQAVAHFIMDGDPLPAQKNIGPYTDARGKLISSNVPGKFLNSATQWNNPDSYAMGYGEPHPDGTRNIVYRRVGDITTEEKQKFNFDAAVRNIPFSQINWDGQGPSTGFLAKSNYIPTTTPGQATSIPYKDKNSFSRFSGGSGVFTFKDPDTGKSINVDVAGSTNTLKDVGYKLISQYGIKPEELQFLYHDMGSYSAKPKADANGNLNYRQWENYNTYNKGHSGAPIVIPKQADGGIQTNTKSAPVYYEGFGADKLNDSQVTTNQNVANFQYNNSLQQADSLLNTPAAWQVPYVAQHYPEYMQNSPEYQAYVQAMFNKVYNPNTNSIAKKAKGGENSVNYDMRSYVPKAEDGLSIYPGGKELTPTGQSNSFYNTPQGLSPEQMKAAAAKYGFRIDSPFNFQEDMYKYISQNNPALMADMVNKYGPAKAGMTNYNGVQSFSPDAMIGARTATIFNSLNTSTTPVSKPQRSIRFEKLTTPGYYKDQEGNTTDHYSYSPIYEGDWSQRDIQAHQKTLEGQTASDGSPYFVGQPWQDMMQKRGPDARSWSSIYADGTKVPMSQLGKKPISSSEQLAYQPLPVPTDPRVKQDAQGNQYAHFKEGGIHIKDGHEGRFTEYLKRTGSTLEEALHSPDPHVRQMANFARNAKHWKKAEGGENPFGQDPMQMSITPEQQQFAQLMYGNSTSPLGYSQSGTLSTSKMDIGKTIAGVDDGFQDGITAANYFSTQNKNKESMAWNNQQKTSDYIYGDGNSTSRGDFTQAGQFHPNRAGNFTTYAEGGIIPEVGQPAVLHEEAIQPNYMPEGIAPFVPSNPISTSTGAAKGLKQGPNYEEVAPDTKVNVNKSAEYAYNFYKQKGLPDHVAAGIVGNLVTESNLNPTVKGDNKQAIGIAQWHPDRFNNLVKWASTKGLNPYNIDTQLQFVYEEASQRGDIAKASKTGSPSQAAVAFGRSFERPSEKYANWNKRAGIAEKLMGSYKDGGTYEMSEDEIRQFLEAGGEIEMINPE